MSDLFFDDIKVGDELKAGPYATTTEEMVEFARKWDPLPIHVDEEAARRSPHGGLIGSGEYTMAIKQLLITRLGISQAVIGAIGYEELRYLRPVRPEDSLTLTVQCLDKRESRSKPDRGVVRFQMTMTNQKSEPVLTYIDLVMMAKRPNSQTSEP